MATADTTTSTPSFNTPVPTWTELSQVPAAPDGHVRFSREAYHRMFDAGVLNAETRYELIDGEIIVSPPIGPGSGNFISRLTDFFVKQLPNEYQCRVQLPIIIGDDSEPEPDLAIVRRRESDYQDEHPAPQDVVLLIEVSHSSLVRDRGQKLDLYAKSDIPEYWIVDVERRQLIIHRSPEPRGYADVQQIKERIVVAPLAIPSCRLELSWLFR
jgi:Uma2 family endonuclease